MIYPSGITEENFLQVVNIISNGMKESYSFGYYDPADIAQECYVFAIDALPKYDTNKGSLYTFLSVHIKRRLLNLRRNKLARPQLPCLDCQACETEEERLRCQKYLKYKKRNDRKRSLMESAELNDFDISNTSTIPPSYSFLLNTELMCLIDKNLPISLRSDYRRFLEGAKLSKKKRTHLINIIKEIIESNKYGE